MKKVVCSIVNYRLSGPILLFNNLNCVKINIKCKSKIKTDETTTL